MRTGDPCLTAATVLDLRVSAERREMSRWGRALLEVALWPAAPAVELRPGGKPVLADAGWGFSLSYSRGHVVLALAPGRHVGVDIERVDRPYGHLLERYFSEEERGRIASRPGRERAYTAWSVWTAKEAAVKANGTGLRFTPPATVEDRPGSGTAAGCRWEALHIDDSLVCSVAVAGTRGESPGWVIRDVEEAEVTSYMRRLSVSKTSSSVLSA